jgi:hypothetical protein
MYFTITTTYHLDLDAGLTQVLDDGQHTYLYGNGRIGYSSDDMYYFLGDAPPLAHPQGCGQRARGGAGRWG